MLNSCNLVFITKYLKQLKALTEIKLDNNILGVITQIKFVF